MLENWEKFSWFLYSMPNTWEDSDRSRENHAQMLLFVYDDPSWMNFQQEYANSL